MFMKPLSRKPGNQRLSFEALEDRSVPAIVAGLPSDTSDTTTSDTKEEPTTVDPDVIFTTSIDDGEVLETTDGEAIPEEATPTEVDLALTETADTSTPSVGQTVTFSVTLQNNSANPASTVTVKDLIPDGMTFISAQTTTGTYESSSDVWTVGDVTTGTPITLKLMAKVTESGSLATTASVESAGSHTDTDVTNNTADIALETSLAKIAVAQTVKSSSVGLGGVTTIVVKVSNTGEGSATSLKVTNEMLAGLSILKATPALGSYNSSTKTWTISNLAAGATARLELNVRVGKVGELTNNVTVTGTGISADESTLSSSATITGKYLTTVQRWVFSPRGGWSTMPTPTPAPAPAPTKPTIIAPAPFTSTSGFLYGRPLASLTNKIPLVKGFIIPKAPVVETEPTTNEESATGSAT